LAHGNLCWSALDGAAGAQQAAQRGTHCLAGGHPLLGSDKLYGRGHGHVLSALAPVVGWATLWGIWGLWHGWLAHTAFRDGEQGGQVGKGAGAETIVVFTTG